MSMFKRSVFAVCLIFFALPFLAEAQSSGYKIKLQVDRPPDSMVYLVHYFGKPLPTIYRIDSAMIDAKGVAVLERDSMVTGGIYMILFSDRQTYFEFLLDNGDDMEITVPIGNLPLGLKFKNSPQ